MSQQEFTVQERTRDFLAIYQADRYDHQLRYYTDRVKEYANAQRQAIWCSIGLIFLTALAGAFASSTSSWLKIVLLLIAAICPILSTALAGYTALHGFTQQAKLYGDARRSLLGIYEPDFQPDQQEDTFTRQVGDYVTQVEDILQKEHSFWGQLAEGMTPPGA